MKRIVNCLLSGGLMAACVYVMPAQSPGPSKILRIIREEVKPGRGAAHERVEAGYVRALAKTSYPGYIALETISGGSEVWFLGRYESYAEMGKAQKIAEEEPLKSTLDSLDAQDGELLTGVRNLICVYHPELSYVPVPPNLPAMRYMSVNMLRIRPGRQQEMAEMRKLLNAAWEKSGSKQRRVVYAVTSGAPSGTYVILGGMASLEAMDQVPSLTMAEAFGDSLGRYRTLYTEIVMGSENTMFAVNPRMSNPPKEYLTAAPDFWGQKPKTSAKGTAARSTPDQHE